MFPVVAIEVRGLDPDKMYTIELSFEQIDAHRWRYVSAQWQPGLKPDAAINRISYQHPDSPNYGRKWMKDPILFSKVKLTNKVDRADASHVSLSFTNDDGSERIRFRFSSTLCTNIVHAFQSSM